MVQSKKRYWVIAIVSVGVMIPFIFPYLTLDPTKSRIAITSEVIEYPSLIIHILFAFIALVTGCFQFLNTSFQKYPKVHRNIGRLYVISVFISSLSSFVVVFYVANFTKSLAFLTLAILWLFTTWKGYRNAVRRRFGEHRIWMIRSFGITLVAVSARLLLPVLFLIYFTLNGFTISAGRNLLIEELLKVNIWIGLVLNIVIVEWVILRQKSVEKFLNQK